MDAWERCARVLCRSSIFGEPRAVGKVNFNHGYERLGTTLIILSLAGPGTEQRSPPATHSYAEGAHISFRLVLTELTRVNDVT